MLGHPTGCLSGAWLGSKGCLGVENFKVATHYLYVYNYITMKFSYLPTPKVRKYRVLVRGFPLEITNDII